MSGLLLDTSFVSVFAPDRQEPPEEFLRWVDAQRARGNWYLPAIAVAELVRGVTKLRRAGAVTKAGRLGLWLETTLNEFEQRILPVDAATAREAGQLADRVSARGHDPGLADILVAATARVNGLDVLTVNTRHFAMLEVEHFNPLRGEFPPG